MSWFSWYNYNVRTYIPIKIYMIGYSIQRNIILLYIINIINCRYFCFLLFLHLINNQISKPMCYILMSYFQIVEIICWKQKCYDEFWLYIEHLIDFNNLSNDVILALIDWNYFHLEKFLFYNYEFINYTLTTISMINLIILN